MNALAAGLAGASARQASAMRPRSLGRVSVMACRCGVGPRSERLTCMQGHSYPTTATGVLELGMGTLWTTTTQPSLPSARTASRPVTRGSGGMAPTVGCPSDSCPVPAANRRADLPAPGA